MYTYMCVLYIYIYFIERTHICMYTLYILYMHISIYIYIYTRMYRTQVCMCGGTRAGGGELGRQGGWCGEIQNAEIYLQSTTWLDKSSTTALFDNYYSESNKSEHPFHLLHNAAVFTPTWLKLLQLNCSAVLLCFSGWPVNFYNLCKMIQ